MLRITSWIIGRGLQLFVCFFIIISVRPAGIASAQIIQTNLAVTVRHAPNLNGSGVIEGSLQQLLGESVTLNGGFTMTGDFLVPGTPVLRQNGNPDFGGIIDGNGSNLPGGYRVTLNGNCSLRYLRTRITPVSLPAVVLPPHPAGSRNVTIGNSEELIGDPITLRNLTLNGSVGQFAIPPGTYGNFIANGGSGFTLGVAGATQPAIYNLQNLTLNGQSRLEIAGPIVLTVANGFAANGILGSSNNPASLQLQLASGGLALNGGCTVYGSVTAPGGTVIINGNSRLVGSIQCDRLIVNSGGIIRAGGTGNQPPMAHSQDLAMDEDDSIPVTLTGSDPEGAFLSFSLLSQPAHGMLSGSAPVLVYTPTTNFNGHDSFTFKVNDGQADSATAEISITVEPINDAPVAQAQMQTTTEDAALDLVLAGTDSDGDALSFAVVLLPAHGDVSGLAPNLTYTPAPDFSGSDSFQFSVNDGQAGATNVVTIHVNAVNDQPFANAQQVVTDEDVSVPVTLTGADAEGSALIFNVVGQPQHGTLSGVLPDLIYVPETNFNGADAFNFQVSDGTLTSAVATVTLVIRPINDPPLAETQVVMTSEDIATNVILAATDPEGNSLQFNLTSMPENGTLSNVAPQFVFSPAADFHGTNSFEFTANDGSATSAPVVVTIVVTPVNDRPIADAKSITLDEDSFAGISLSGSDADGDVLTYTVTLQPTNGSLSGIPPNLIYTPATNYSGSDSFSYQTHDGTTNSESAFVALSILPINDVPAGNDDVVVTDEDTHLPVTLRANDVESDTLSFEISTPPLHGELTGVAPDLIYTPETNYHGADTFQFVVHDGQADSAAATILITINAVNDRPVAMNDSVETLEDAVAPVVLGASDVDGDMLNIQIITGPAHGSLTGNPSNLTYVPAADFFGNDAFTFLANDGQAESAPATITLNVAPMNDPPRLTVPGDQTIAEDAALVFNTNQPIVLSDIDVGGGFLKLSVSATNGTISLGATNGLIFEVGMDCSTNIVVTGSLADLNAALAGLTYLGQTNFSGSDSIVLLAGDQGNSGVGGNLTDLKTIALTIIPVNEPPVANAISVSTAEDSSADFTLSGSDTEGNVLSFSILSLPSHGALTGTAPALVYTPAANFNGSDSFTFRVNDGEEDSTPAIVALTIAPVNDPPTAAGQSVSVMEGQSVPVALQSDDVDGDELSFVITRQPRIGVLSGSGSNFVYTANTGTYGFDSFDFYVSDGGMTSGVATVAVQVTPFARGRTYTLNNDFAEGELISLLATNEDLQTTIDLTHFNYVWVPVQSRGTVMRLDAETGRVLGEYRLHPNGRPNGYPSRVVVDQSGNCWVANERDNSVIMIAAPEGASWIDKNHDGKLTTSQGQGDILPWTNPGGVDNAGGVSSAEDELIAHYVRVTDSGVRHISINRAGDLWVSGTATRAFDLINHLNGEIIRTEPSIGRGGFGGFVDDNDVLWSSGTFLNWDTHLPLSSAATSAWNSVPEGSFACAQDSQGNVWVTYESGAYGHKVLKFAPNGVRLGEYTHGGGWGQGIAIDSNDDVWIAYSHCGYGVGHLKNDGTLIGSVPTAHGPTAISIDRKGRVWVSTTGGIVQRINPAGGPIGKDGLTPVGEVELTSPYLGGYLWTYGDFTGSASALRTQRGLWTVVFDSGLSNAPWASLQWNATLWNDGTLPIRVATSEDGTNFTSLQSITLEDSQPAALGRYLKIIGDFIPATSGDGSVLHDLTVGTLGWNISPATTNWQISAGQDFDAYWPDAVQLKGAVAHSAHNIAVNPTVEWTVVSGPGSVNFDDTQSIQPTLHFSTNGVYTFRITANNHGEVQTDEVTVSLTPYNRAPWAEAGPNLFVGDYTQSAILQGTVRDDGLPLTNTLQVLWTQLFGPGTTLFENSTSAVTSATFSTNGIYILQLTADDGEYKSTALVTVRVGAICTVADVSGLQAWWQANGTGDDHANGNQAFLENGATYAQGKVGAAFDFDGVDDRVSVGSNPHINLAKVTNPGFTVEFWMSPNSFQNGSVLGWANGVRVERYPLGYTGDTLRFYVTGTGGGQYVEAPRVWNNTSWNWTHVALTYDRTIGQAKIYINGVLTGTASMGTNLLSTADEFYLGQVPGSAGVYKGQLDEVSLYSRTLDPQEIYQIYASADVGKCPLEANQAPSVNAGADLFVTGVPGLANLNGEVFDDGLPVSSSVRIQWSQFSGPGSVTFSSPTSAVSSVTFSTNGIYVLKLTAEDGDIQSSDLVEVRVESLCTIDDPQGLAAWWPGNGTTLDLLGRESGIQVSGASYLTGKVASALFLDGVNDSIWMLARSNYDVGSSASGFTVEFWMNPNSFQNGSVLGWANGVRVERYSLGYTGDTLRFYVTGTGGGQYVEAPRVWNYTSWSWTHVALTYDRGSGQAKIYINGVLSSVGFVGTNLLSTTGDFYLGQVPGSANFFNGELDEVSLYRRPLDPEEVYNVFASGSAGKCPNDENTGPVVYAGPDLFVTGVPDVAVLNGEVSDDGLPEGSNLRLQWNKFSGPGEVVFSNATSTATTATFSTNGIYVLQLTADDGEVQTRDLVEVRVESLCTIDDPEGLAAWWPGNGTDLDVINSEDAILGSGTSYTPGKVASAFNFDGANDYMWMLARTNYDVGSSPSGFTVEFWMNPNSFQNGSVLGWANGVRIERYASGYIGDTLRFYVAGTGGGPYVEAPRVWNYTSWSWTHVALTYDRMLGQAKIYINGVLSGIGHVGTNLLSTAGDFYLGQVPGSANFFSGQLDEVSLYKRPLDPEEVYNVFASGSAGKCPNDDNTGPMVYAGPDIFVIGTPGTTVLTGQATDDGLPEGSNLRLQWSRFSGPGEVVFSNATSTATTATFSTNGIYVLQLTADDGEVQTRDLVEVRVESLCTIDDPEGLAAWWPGNGADLEVINNEDAIQGSGTSYTPGKVASAFNFDGANDYMWMLARTNYDVGSSPSGFTVEFWMNPNSFQNGSVLGWANGVRVERYGLGYTGDTLRFYVAGTGGGPYVEAPRVWNYTSWSWTHVALTYDRMLGQAKIYINGVLSGIGHVGTNSLSTTGDFYLGQVPGSANFFSGQLDEVSLYRRPLDPEEVYNVFASGSAGKCPNDDNTGPVVYAGPDISVLVATNAAALNGIVSDDGLPNGSSPRTDWNVFSGPGSVIFGDPTSAVTPVTFSANGIYVLQLSADDGEISNRDLVVVRVGTPCSVSDLIGLSAFWPASGTAQDAISGAFGILGGGVDYASGKVASAFNFDGANDYVWMLARTNYNVGSSTSGFTVEFWMNPNSFQNGSVLGWANGVRMERYGLGYTGDTLRFYVAGTGAGQYVEAPRVWNYTGWSWTHVALTYDRTLGQGKIYINGVLSGTTTVGTNLLSTAGDFYLGQVPGSAGFFKGQQDEVSLYTRPLPLSEIQAIFNAGSSGKCLSPANQPPTVAAGTDRIIFLPSDTVTLNGAVFDDGLPSEHELTIAWNYIAGDSTVFFSNTNTPSTTITFTNAGVYTFELSASDGQFTTNDTVAVTVLPDPRTAPAVAVTGPVNGTFIQVAAGQTTNLQLVASAFDADGAVTHVEFFIDGVSTGSDEVAPFSIVASNLAVGSYSITAVAIDNDGLSMTSAPISVTVYVDSGAPTVAVFLPTDANIVTAPTDVIGTAFSPLLQSYEMRYRFKQADGIPPAGWTVLASGSTSVISNTLTVFDPTLLLNGIYEIQLAATDTLGRTALSEIQTLIVDRNLKIGHFTIAFNDLTVPAAGLPIQITRTYDSRAAASGIPGDFGIGWTMDIRNVRLQKNRPLGRNWEETSSGGGFTAYALDSGQQRIVSITFPDGRQEKFRFEPNPLVQIIEPIEFPQWRFTPIGNTHGTLVPAGFDDPDGNFLWVVGSVPGPVDIYDLNFLSENPFATEAELNRYPTLFRYTSAEGVRYLIDEIDGLQSVTDLNGNTLLISTNGLTWTNSAAGTNKLSVAFQRNGQGYITNIVDVVGHSMSYRYSTNGNLAGYTDRAEATNGFAYDHPAFPHHLTSIVDARGVAPVQNQYDADGRLIGNIDAFGAAITYGHDLANNREYITNRLGQVTATEYDEFGNVTRVIDATGAETVSAYDENGNLLQMIDPLGRTNRYTYDSLDNRLSVTDPLGNTTRFSYGAQRRVTSVTDPRGNAITNTFDARGNLLSMRDPLGNVTRFAYDAQGSPVAVTNALGQVMQFGYDSRGRLVTEVDPLGHSTAYVRDANGNLLTQTTTRTTPSGLETLNVQFFYDTQSRLTNSIFPDGSSAQTIYNDIGKPAIVIDQQGRQTLMEYDDLGRTIRTVYPDGGSESIGYDAEGRRTSSTNRLGQVTQYFYDAVGRLNRTVMPDGAATTNWFDLAGQLVASSDARGNNTFYGYDAAGRSVTVTNALGEVSLSLYDASGNVTNTVDALGRSTQFIYDSLNRRVQTVFADGTTQTTWFDELGRRTHEQDQAGKVTAFGYDAVGRMTAMTNALGYVTSYTYDELGQQISQTDANHHTTTFEYDSLGRRIKRVLPEGQIETCAYDVGGLLTNKTDFNGYITSFQYDLMNRLVAKMPDSRLGAANVTYQYNALGLRTNMTDGSGVTAYLYDGRNRLTQKIKTWSGAALDIALNYRYDANGNLTNVVSSDPNGTDLGYEYDALNRLSAVNDAKVGRTAYSYDDIGNLQGYTYPNGVHMAYQYDSLNRLTNLASSALLTPIANYTYTVGPVGNRLTAIETVQPNGAPHTIDRVYNYDELYRLTGETINGAQNGSASYGYDPVGNRLSRGVLNLPILPQSFNFDSNDRVASDSFDLNGNTLFSPGFGQSQPDRYDFENRLIARQTTTNLVEIEYDGDGNRVSKKVTAGGITTITCYVVDELNPSGYAQVLEEHVSVNFQSPAISCIYAYGQTLISQDRLDGSSWRTSFYGYDGHNNVRYLTDLNGSVTDTYDYDAFGNLIARTGITENHYLFTGEQFDSDLNLYYLRARYHNPDTGRFWTQDSFEGNGSDPASLHKYAYCGNNPINTYDPSGKFSIAELGHSAVIGGLTTAWIGSISRAVGAASAGAGWKESLDAANEGIVDDFTSGALGGAFGYGIGKAAFWAIGKAAPYLLSIGPVEALVAYAKASTKLNSAYAAATRAWNALDAALIQGSESAVKGASATLSQAYREILKLRGLANTLAERLGFSTAAKGPLALSAPKKFFALPGLTGAVDDIVVIGTRGDTLAAEGWAGHKILNIKNWNIANNDAFVASAIQNRQTVYLASPINYGTLWDAAAGRNTVFSRELGQFFQAGYKQVGNNLIPPPLP